MLRERYFGRWDKTSNRNYEKVWADDKVDPNHTNYGVESAAHVQERTTALILLLEGDYSGKKILLASHGDALQILQTGFLGISPSLHRDIPHLNVAEIRELTRKS
jgi:broad specificity phosphatase PhoE